MYKPQMPAPQDLEKALLPGLLTESRGRHPPPEVWGDDLPPSETHDRYGEREDLTAPLNEHGFAMSMAPISMRCRVRGMASSGREALLPLPRWV
jgi:hypothetical protein